MRQLKQVTTTTVASVTTDITCNRCGYSCRDSADINYEGLLDVQLLGGFASKLDDGAEYNFDVCENCLILWFSEFKHDPKVY